MKINIDILSTDSDLRVELFRIISAHYPDRLIHSYAHEREFFSDNEKQDNSIVFIHDIIYLESDDKKEFLTDINSRNNYPVLVLTKPDYKLITATIGKGIDDFLYMSENEQLITARIRTILHAFSEKIKSLEATKNLSSSDKKLKAVIASRIPGAHQRLDLISHIADWLYINSESTDTEGRQALKIASNLSLIGRLALTDEALHKPVSKDGYANGDLMYQIPHSAYAILAADGNPGQEAEILKHIYENIDGSGFPDKLESWQIPIESRILRVAMALEERLHNGFDTRDSLKQIQQLAGRVYDKRIVALLPEYIDLYLDKLREGEMSIGVLQLKPWMKLTRDIITNQGMKLIPAGKVLDERQIKIVASHTKIDPVNGHIYVERTQH